MNRRKHWEQVHRTRKPDEVSWFQPVADLSLALIRSAAPDPDASIIDIGGGASTLVDDLLAGGYRDVTVLDLSGAALARVRERLGSEADRVRFIEGDVLRVPFPSAAYAFWHDRAAFHFLTDPDDRARYVAQVRHAVAPGGRVLIATFAADGPTRCSGLDVERYSPSRLSETLGDDFELLEARQEEHRTPSGSIQRFTYGLFRLREAGSGA